MGIQKTPIAKFLNKIIVYMQINLINISKNFALPVL